MNNLAMEKEFLTVLLVHNCTLQITDDKEMKLVFLL